MKINTRFVLFVARQEPYHNFIYLQDMLVKDLEIQNVDFAEKSQKENDTIKTKEKKVSDVNFIPAQIRPETHRKLLAVKAVTGLPIYQLIDSICKVGFSKPGLFGVHPTMHKEIKNAITNSD